jgi:hypothetical protein
LDDPFDSTELVGARFKGVGTEEGTGFGLAFAVAFAAAAPVLPDRLRLSIDKPSVGVGADVGASDGVGGRLRSCEAAS